VSTDEALEKVGRQVPPPSTAESLGPNQESRAKTTRPPESNESLLGKGPIAAHSSVSPSAQFSWLTGGIFANSSTISGTGEPSGMLYARIVERGVSQTRSPILNVGRSVFLGEAFSLTYVVHDVLASFLGTSTRYQKRLHFPITDTAHEDSSRLSRHINAAQDRLNF
jgi:hypothetical protein